MAENEEELKSLLMNVKEESGKAGLKIIIGTTLFFLGLQNHCRWSSVTAATKLKGACSLDGKL